MYNPFIDKPKKYIIIEGEKFAVKTDFELWVRLLIASGRQDADELTAAIIDILNGVPSIDISQSLIDWLNQFEGKNEPPKKGKAKKKAENKQAFDFDYDGAVIFAELWQYYPSLMQRGINYFEGIALIHQIIQKGYTESELSRRAFARCGDFSKMEQKEREQWLKLRNEYALPNEVKEQEEKLKMIDELFYNS